MVVKMAAVPEPPSEGATPAATAVPAPAPVPVPSPAPVPAASPAPSPSPSPSPTLAVKAEAAESPGAGAGAGPGGGPGVGAGTGTGTGAGAAPAPAPGTELSERHTLLAVLQFLKKNRFREAEETLRREASVQEGPDEALRAAGPRGSDSVHQPDVSSVLSAYSNQGDPSLYEEYYCGLKAFIEAALDALKAELASLLYPVFVHLYLELVYNEHEREARLFFHRSAPMQCGVWDITLSV